MEELHRLRVAVDVIHTGPKLSPTARNRVAHEVATHAHTLGFESVKNATVVFGERDDRVVYAHYHDSPSDGAYCDVRGQGCLTQGRDGYNQEGLG